MFKLRSFCLGGVATHLTIAACGPAILREVLSPLFFDREFEHTVRFKTSF
jgi:hypothetical protein